MIDGNFNKKGQKYKVKITLQDTSIIEREYIGTGKDGPLIHSNPDPINHPEKNLKLIQIKRIKSE